MIFRQLFDRESSTYTYLLADPKTRRAALIDPVLENLERDLALVRELGLELTHVLETHVHADHVTAGGLLRQRTGAKTVVSERGGAECASRHVGDGDRVALGELEIEVRATPGHTNGCLSYVVRDGARTLAFTGDALLVRGCGRTDFQQGDSRTLYRSVRDQLYTLPDDTEVFPGHDYRGHTTTTIAEEKAHNPRLATKIGEAEFVRMMAELKLANPKLMDVAVPANLACGGAK